MKYQIVRPPCTDPDTNLDPVFLSQKLHFIDVTFVVVILDVRILRPELLVEGPIAFGQTVVRVDWENNMSVLVCIVTILVAVLNLR